MMNYFGLGDIDYELSELDDRWTIKIKISQLEREINELENEIEFIKNENLQLNQKEEIYNIKIIEYNCKELNKLEKILNLKINELSTIEDKLDIESIEQTNNKPISEKESEVKRKLFKIFEDTELTKLCLGLENPSIEQRKAYISTLKDFRNEVKNG